MVVDGASQNNCRTKVKAYTPPTPTRLNCRVDSRRWCVLNLQLIHDGFGRNIDKKAVLSQR